MPAKKDRAINLLPQEEFAATTVGRILTWLLSTFRVIVIVTEVVVMLAFLSRFWLDARNADLNDLLTQKKAIISAFSDFESQFKGAQKKLAIIQALTPTDKSVGQTLNLTSLYLPPDVILNSFSTSSNEITLQGASASEASIAQYVANLEGSNLFDNVSILRVGSDETDPNTLVFTLKATQKGGKS